MSEYDVHPMLEPVNYDIDPETAKNYLTGNHLEIYTLLWNAAFATYIEGPVVREHSLSIDITSKANLCLTLIEMIESGWSTYIPFAGYEDSQIVSQGVIPSFIPLYQEEVLPQVNIASTITLPLSEGSAIKAVIKKKSKPDIDYSSLVKKMAEQKVARPSTYASRLMLMEKNGLIEEKNKMISLTQKGENLLEIMSKQPINEQVNAQLSYEIEAMLRTVENDQHMAGYALDHFCQVLFNRSTRLVSWLDNLQIQEDTSKTYFSEIIDNASSLDSKCNNINVKNESILEILKDDLSEQSIQFEEHDWDDFTFFKTVSSIRFKGRLRTRKACESTVSKERIFKEHLNDFNSIIYMGFIRYLPAIDSVSELEFLVMTDRTKGFLHLESLHIIYSNCYEVEDGESTIEDKKSSISALFDEIDLSGIRLLGCFFEDNLIISMRNDPSL